jgi:translation elongation factor EF-Tu-like GTPase
MRHASAVGDDARFRFRVREAFTLTGRGTVVAGYIESGELRAGDHLVLIHGDERIPVVCQGASPLREAGWLPGDSVLVGLSIPDLPAERAAADDLVTSVE